MYRDIVNKIADGTLRNGDLLPSMRDLSTRYHVGLRTVRDVLNALKDDGYIITEERKRAVVCAREDECGEIEEGIRSLLARKEDVLESLETLELIMPPLFFDAVRYCSDPEIEQICRLVGGVDLEVREGDWKISRSSQALHKLLKKTGNPLSSECYASLERMCLVPVYPGFESPYESAAAAAPEGGLPKRFESLKSRDPEEIKQRFGSLYGIMAEYMSVYFDALEAACPFDGERDQAYSWNAKTGKDYAYVHVARDIVSRIAAGEYDDGDSLPSISGLSEAYGISLSSVQKTLALLNEMGVVQTVNGRGSQVRLSNVHFDLNALSNEIFMRDVDVFVNALRMLCIILPAVLDSVTDRMEVIERCAEGYLAADSAEWAIPRVLMKSIIDAIPLRPLQVVVSELNELLVWGHFFVFFGPTGEGSRTLAAIGERASEYLHRNDAGEFADAIVDYYRTMLVAVQDFLSSVRQIGRQ